MTFGRYFKIYSSPTFAHITDPFWPPQLGFLSVKKPRSYLRSLVQDTRQRTVRMGTSTLNGIFIPSNRGFFFGFFLFSLSFPTLVRQPIYLRNFLARSAALTDDGSNGRMGFCRQRHRGANDDVYVRFPFYFFTYPVKNSRRQSARKHGVLR